MIYIQNLRKNDIGEDHGKQIELGKNFMALCQWSTEEVAIRLYFKTLENQRWKNLNNYKIETKFKVRGTERGGDRPGVDCKEYANENGDLPLKDFFTYSLNLCPENVGLYYFVLESTNNNNTCFNLYVIDETAMASALCKQFIQKPITIEELPSNAIFHYCIPLQQIFYGAPGTGKSYTINRDTAGEDVIRTTFHPDTDYSTFVGAYKPTTIEEEVMTVIGTKAVPVENADGTHRKESKIVYEFVQQSFLQAYVAAWKKYAETQDGEPRKQFLVIEEINRGNCAQIFGDLFQLLDRNTQGFSDYPITADADMKRQLKKAFAGLTLANGDSINAIYDGRNVCQEVLEGEILLLPNNLYIWATMNTSDQSLFPIDSAFKRRWDWQYMPISNANLNWAIEVNGNKYEWWQFLEKINEKIWSLTNSEDKKLGYFFCKANNEGVISAETFVGKVIFYLWNDVFKDYDFSDTIFDDGKGDKLSFDKFYMANSNVNEEKIRMFLENIGMMPIEDAIEDIDEDSVNSNGKTIPKYSINGSSEQFSTPNAVRYIIENYAKQNENISVDEMIQLWNGIAGRNILVSEWQPSPNDNQPFKNKRRVEIKWGACSAWLSKGWTEDLFKTFIQKVKDQLDISIKIDRVN